MPWTIVAAVDQLCPAFFPARYPLLPWWSFTAVGRHDGPHMAPLYVARWDRGVGRSAETRWTACRVGLMLVRMEFCLHADVESFWDSAGPLYEADPIRHTVALTVIGGMRAERRLSLRSTDDAGIAGDGEGSRSSGEPAGGADGQNDGTNPLLVTIVATGRTIGAAFYTPPYPIGVSGVPVECVPKLATFLRERGVRLSGVTGPSDVSNAFAHEWGLGTTEVMRMRCYRLDDREPPDVPGSMRLAGVEDIPQLQAFEREFFR